METYKSLVAQALETVEELFPWDLLDLIEKNTQPFLLDIREPDEFNEAHIKGSINVPRGILEAACDWNFSETEPELVQSRKSQVIVICRSGNRSALAAKTMQFMGFEHVISLKTGIRGWNDSEYELVDINGQLVDGEHYDDVLNMPVPKHKLQP
ncbi:MAG: rhodanese-like domain-containing protein [bacterium]